jgi:uncharacterized protein YgbK (DUF1537 family)
MRNEEMANEEMTRRVVVIADDITGAAEIAGIAFEAGRQVQLLCTAPSSSVSGCSTATPPAPSSSVSGCSTATPPPPAALPAPAATTVIATDTRSMTALEAAAETRRVISHFSFPFPIPHSSFLIYKKTDSALRGHVVEELSALLESTGYHRAVYLPANPSKGRIIRNGTYYIMEATGADSQRRAVPIHETDFRFDPEFPAKTSVLKERFPDAEAHGIIMPDAESADDIRRIITYYADGQTLFAGAADLFTALLDHDHGGGSPDQGDHGVGSPDQFLISHSSFLISNSVLILCGSTQSKPLDLGIPVAPMPREVYDGEQGADFWLAHLSTSLPHREGQGEGLILSIPYTHRTGKEAAVHLRTMMAQTAKELITKYLLPTLDREGQGEGLHLIIEGGATAWATLQALGWTQFQIVRQIAPGVVQMSATIACNTSPDKSKKHVMVTLKPGSYPWGGMFK